MPRSHSTLQVVRPAAKASKPRASAGAGADGGTSTQRIVESITAAIVERRLMPGTKLAEQKIADIFKVSRTLVRQALNQLSRDKLVTLEPARTGWPLREIRTTSFGRPGSTRPGRRIIAWPTKGFFAEASRPRPRSSSVVRPSISAPATWPFSMRSAPRASTP